MEAVSSSETSVSTYLTIWLRNPIYYSITFSSCLHAYVRHLFLSMPTRYALMSSNVAWEWVSLDTAQVSNYIIYRPYILLNNWIFGRKVFDSSFSSNPLEMLAEQRKEWSSVIYSTYQHFSPFDRIVILNSPCVTEWEMGRGSNAASRYIGSIVQKITASSLWHKNQAPIRRRSPTWGYHDNAYSTWAYT
jgi:hypothetical protein